jgi:hypothetical protein
MSALVHESMAQSLHVMYFVAKKIIPLCVILEIFKTSKGQKTRMHFFVHFDYLTFQGFKFQISLNVLCGQTCNLL